MKKTVLLAAALLLTAAGAFAQTDTPAINKRNLVIKEWNTDAKTKTRVLDHVTTYNADGKKVEEIEYSQSKQKWRKRYEYDASGRLSREFVYNERNRLDNYKKFEYNEFGRKKIQYTYNAKGTLITIKVYEYIAEDT